MAVRIVACVIGGLIGAALGLYFGALFGGNYATDFQLGDRRGYEATGRLGLFVGLALGGLLGLLLARGLQSPRHPSNPR